MIWENTEKLSLTLEAAPFQTLTHSVGRKKGNSAMYNNTHILKTE